MLLDFKNLKSERLNNFKGGEKYVDAVMHVDEDNRIMYGALPPGGSIGLHTHEGTSEAIYVIKGNLKALYDGKEEYLSEGMCHYCEKGHTHTILNESAEDAQYFAVIPNHK
ncbi:MAG: cupin domain-containing protein [Clostridia bacterium]|nr:cupin domain-containing protein [Clostridia bacterium]